MKEDSIFFNRLMLNGGKSLQRMDIKLSGRRELGRKTRRDNLWTRPSNKKYPHDHLRLKLTWALRIDLITSAIGYIIFGYLKGSLCKNQPLSISTYQREK